MSGKHAKPEASQLEETERLLLLLQHAMRNPFTGQPARITDVEAYLRVKMGRPHVGLHQRATNRIPKKTLQTMRDLIRPSFVAGHVGCGKVDVVLLVGDEPFPTPDNLLPAYVEREFTLNFRSCEALGILIGRKVRLTDRTAFPEWEEWATGEIGRDGLARMEARNGLQDAILAMGPVVELGGLSPATFPLQLAAKVEWGQ